MVFFCVPSVGFARGRRSRAVAPCGIERSPVVRVAALLCPVKGLGDAIVQCRTIMSFRAGNLKDAHLPLYTLNGEALCDSACVKYLGHFICSDLSDDTDILRQRMSNYSGKYFVT